MSPQDPVRQVVRFLSAAGYREQSEPLSIGPIEHHFAAALIGDARSIDLVVLVDTLTETEHSIRTKVRNLGRALDHVSSHRPLSVVLVGPIPTSGTIRAVSEVARVLAVGAGADEMTDDGLADVLAALLPLDWANSAEHLQDPIGLVRDSLNMELEGSLADSLLRAAGRGPESVGKLFRAAIDSAVSEVESQT